MKKNLFQYAVISSPILAFYGVIPLYIFQKLNFTDFAFTAGGTAFNIFVVWLINIYITLKQQLVPNWKKYIASYISIFLFTISVALIRNQPPHIEQVYIAYPILTSAAFNAIILMLCNSVVNAHRRQTAELEVRELKFQNSEAQKKILQQQLHPHFLFNALSVLKSLIKENPKEAEHYSYKLSEFLQYSVKAPTQVMVSLQEEIEFTNGYVELQKARFGTSFTYTIEVPNSAKGLHVPVYALQALVENAFKHNYFTEEKPLSIAVAVANNQLTVTNNKVSMKVTERSGTGLANLNQRLVLLTGSELAVTETDNAFSVSIQLPAR